MISQLSSCGPSFCAIPNGKLPSKSPAKVQGEHLKIKKLTFLINRIEVAGVMVARSLLQLFQPLLLQSLSPMVSCGKGAASCMEPGGPLQADYSEWHRALPCAGGSGSVAAGSAPDFTGCVWELLPCIWALAVSCGAAQRPLDGLWMGLALSQPRMVPEAPGRSGDPAIVHTERSCCLQEPRFLSYGRQEVFREGGKQRWEKAARSLERVANAALGSSLSPAAIPGAV